MDAEQYYIRGVAQVKNGDMVQGRQLLLQSLKLNQANDKAWVWVAKTIAEPDKKLDCLERALAINPNNADAIREKQALTGKRTVKGSNPQQIKRLMTEAETLVAQGRKPEASDRWLMVLDMQADHEEALRNASQYYMERDMRDAVKEILYNAVEHRTENASILLSALDIAKHEGDHVRVDTLNELIALSPQITPKRIVKIANDYVKEDLFDNAIRVLKSGLQAHPKDQALLHSLAEVHEKLGREDLAMQYYEEVANQSARSKLGKEADKRLSQSVPVLTDRERGSKWLAWREVIGIFLLFFILAWEDAGLNVATMSIRHWMGVLLSIVGGYLVVTATSSPQQFPVATLFGGRVPFNPSKTAIRKVNPLAMLIRGAGIDIDEANFHYGPMQEPTELPIMPSWIRMVFGISGIIMLVLAVGLIFTNALGLVRLPEPYLDPEFYSIFFGMIGF